MAYRVEFNNNGEKRYVNFATEDPVDLAISIIDERVDGETYKKSQFKEAREVRNGDKIILRTKSGETEYQTLEEAQSEAAKLNANEGYSIISLEQPVGSKPTVLVEERPSFEEE